MLSKLARRSKSYLREVYPAANDNDPDPAFEPAKKPAPVIKMTDDELAMERELERLEDYAKGPALGLGKTVENKYWRLHRYATNIMATNLDNAGLRGKTVTVYSVSPTNPVYQLVKKLHPKEDADAFVLELLGKFFTFSLNKDQKNGVRVALDALEQYAPESVDITMRNLRGVDVVGTASELEISNKEFSLTSTPQEFLIKDLMDKNNMPCQMQVKRTHAAKLNKLLIKDAKKVELMTLSSLKKYLDSNGIESHYWCAMD